MPKNQQTKSSRDAMALLVLSAYCLMLATGCIRRQLTIRSEPPGAEILVNDKRLGLTPYAYDFVWYGWYRIALTKPGYERHDDHVLIRSPFYLWIPFDLAMELLPFPVWDRKLLAYQLIPKTPLPEPVRPAPPSTEPAKPAAEQSAPPRSESVSAPPASSEPPAQSGVPSEASDAQAR